MTAEKIGTFEVGGKLCRWKPTFEDNQFTSAGGTASTLEFICDHDVDFMFQAADASLAASQRCEEIEMILDVRAVSVDDFGPERSHMFMACRCYEAMIPAFFDWLSKEHPEVRTVVSAVDDSLVGQEMDYGVRKSCEHYGLDVKESIFSPAPMPTWRET